MYTKTERINFKRERRLIRRNLALRLCNTTDIDSDINMLEQYDVKQLQKEDDVA